MNLRRFSGALAAAVIAITGVAMVRGAEPSHVLADPQASDSPPRPTTPWSAENDSSYDPDDVAALAEEEGVTLEEAELRMRLETAAMALQASVGQRWPDTHGGMWLQTGGPPGLVVAFTKDAEANQAILRAAFEFPELLRTQTVERSRADLEAQHSRMVEERDQLAAGKQPSGIADAVVGTGGSYALGIRESKNAVMVYLPEVTSELRSAFEQTYGHDVVLEERAIEPLACTPTDCRYTLRGGLKIPPAAPLTTHGCSSAFAAFSPNNYYLLSAGHCDDVQRYHAGEHFGRVTAEREAGSVDAERIYRPYPNGWYVGADIVVDTTNLRPIHHHITWSNTMENTWIGKSGWRTGTTRGYILDKDVSVIYIIPSSRFILTDLCARGGDSGGSVFRGDTAYGIVSGGNGLCDEDAAMVFGNIVYAIDAVQLQLLASP